MKNKTPKTLSTTQAMRYSRQILLPDFDLHKQERLINASALIIGLGGLGCAASQYLAAAGVGHLTLVDDDSVESTNLQRQILHFENDIGQTKVDSAAAKLNAINHYVKVDTICSRLSEQALKRQVSKHNIVLDCSDNLQTRNLVNATCYAQLTPLVSGSAIRMEGQLMCIVPKLASACYACLSRTFGEQNLSCVESGIMSPVVGVIGASQANESIKILAQYGEIPIDKIQLYDAMKSQWNTFALNPVTDCKVCSHLSNSH